MMSWSEAGPGLGLMDQWQGLVQDKWQGLVQDKWTNNRVWPGRMGSDIGPPPTSDRPMGDRQRTFTVAIKVMVPF